MMGTKMFDQQNVVLKNVPQMQQLVQLNIPTSQVQHTSAMSSSAKCHDVTSSTET